MKIIAFTNNDGYHLGTVASLNVKELFEVKPELNFILYQNNNSRTVFQVFRDGKRVIKHNYQQQFLNLYNRLLKNSKEVANNGN